MAKTTPVNSGYTIINGSTTGSNGSKVNTWLEYKVLSQSIANNTSTVRVILYSQATISSSTQQTGTARQYGYVQAGASTSTKYYLSTTFTYENYNLNKFADHTFTIAHETNGTKSIRLAGAFDISAYVGQYITGGSASATVTVTDSRGFTATASVTIPMPRSSNNLLTLQSYNTSTPVEFVVSDLSGTTLANVTRVSDNRSYLSVDTYSANVSMTITIQNNSTSVFNTLSVTNTRTTGTTVQKTIYLQNLTYANDSVGFGLKYCTSGNTQTYSIPKITTANTYVFWVRTRADGLNPTITGNEITVLGSLISGTYRYTLCSVNTATPPAIMEMTVGEEAE